MSWAKSVVVWLVWRWLAVGVSHVGNSRSKAPAREAVASLRLRSGKSDRVAPSDPARAALQISVIPTTQSQQDNQANTSENPEGPQQPPRAKNGKRPRLFSGQLAVVDAREQWKEITILITLILVRLHMLTYVDALNSTSADQTHAFKLAIKNLALQQQWVIMGPSLIIISLLLLALLLRRPIPRRLLDVVAGAFITINLIVHFLKINLLLLTPPAAPNLLLGQLLTYLVFFVLAWGWIFWRVDWVGRGRPGTVIEVTDAGDQLSMFDYYHASLMTIVRRSHSEVIGKSRNGRMLVAIHTFMVLDLIAVALGRFYQLIIKMI